MICREIGWRSPYEAFAPLVDQPQAHMLHGGDQSIDAEWSMIVAAPSTVIQSDYCGRGECPFARLQSVMSQRKHFNEEAIPLPFLSGAVGYVSYEAACNFDKKLVLPDSDDNLPFVCFGIYDAVASFSRKTSKAYITGFTEGACDALCEILGNSALPDETTAPGSGLLRSNFTRQSYEKAVAIVIEKILDGDFYQANISQRLSFESDAPLRGFDIFQRLAAMSDAYHGAFLQFEKGNIISNSPERFFRLGGDGARDIIVEPIKGTRPRGRDKAEDEALAESLLADPKDRAENIMIADLMRNDLSKICEDTSINEDAICELMSLAHVHHLVSRISGKLKADIGIADIFAALFPSGSITGAPKHEAMKTIAGIEQVGRGPYCGAVGYIDDGGAADFSVAIRTLIMDQSKSKLSMPVGGGITLRSNPMEEYTETIVKARGALNAIDLKADDIL